MKCLMKLGVIFLLITLAVVIEGTPFEAGKDDLTLGRKRFLFDLNEPAEEENSPHNIFYAEPRTSSPVSESAVTLRNNPVKLPIVSPVGEPIINLSSGSSSSGKRHPDDRDSKSSANARMDPSHEDGFRGANENSSQLQQTRKAVHKRPRVYRMKSNFQHRWKGIEQTTEPIGEPLKVHDWGFAICDLEKHLLMLKYGKVVLPHPTAKVFFDSLEKRKIGIEPSTFFWIPRADAKSILQQFFVTHQSEFRFPEEFRCDTFKNHSLHKVLLMISNKRICLDQYQFFSEDLIKRLRTIIGSNMLDPSSMDSQNKLGRIISFTEEVTKVSQLLILIYLTLHNEHPEEILTSTEIHKFVDWIGNLWFEINKGGEEFLTKYLWAPHIYRLFSLDRLDSWPKRHKLDRTYFYSSAWNFFWVWVEDYERRKFPASNYSIYSKKNLSSIMTRIIYYSNYETISNWIKERKKKKTC